MLSKFSWDNIALVKTLSNVVQGTLDNSAHKKILFYVVLILLRQNCVVKNAVQCYPRDSG